MFKQLGPGTEFVEALRHRILSNFSELSPRAFVTGLDGAAQLVAWEFVNRPFIDAVASLLQQWNNLALPFGERGKETFQFQTEKFLQSAVQGTVPRRLD